VNRFQHKKARLTKINRAFLSLNFYRSNAALISISCSLRWLAALPVAGLALRYAGVLDLKARFRGRYYAHAN